MLDTTQAVDIGPLGPSIKPDFIEGITLERQIGSGATSTVYLGRDKADPEKTYAVKLLTQYLLMHEDARKRWDREAALILELDHPNIVKGIRHGIVENRPFLVMEFLQGEPLDDRLRRMGKLPELEIINIGKSTLRALDAANAKNILHRDVKPANLIWLNDGTVKLMDFGLAKMADDTSITMTGSIVGTPLYVSPEQARGDPKINTRSDLYALGVMLFHLSAGTPPFSELNTSLLLTRKITDDVPDVRLIDGSVSGRMAYFIDRLCQRNPENRPGTPAEALRMLEQLESGALTTTHFEPQPKSPRGFRPASFSDIHLDRENHVISTIASDSQLDTKPQFLEPGQVLFYEDDDAPDCYILLSGAVEVLRSGRPIAVIDEPGSFIGEMGPLRGAPRSATVAAKADTILLVIEGEAFQEFFSRHPEMAIALAQSLATRLESTSAKYEESQTRLANLTKHVNQMRAVLRGNH